MLFVTKLYQKKEHVCVYQVVNALHHYVCDREIEYLKIIDDSDSIIINYFDAKKEAIRMYIFYSKTNEMIEGEYNQVERSKYLYIDKKNFKLNGREVEIYAYHGNYVDLVSDNWTFFFNKKYGVILRKSGNYVTPLIVFDEDSIEIKKIVEAIKSDSSFYNSNLFLKEPPSFD